MNIRTNTDSFLLWITVWAASRFGLLCKKTCRKKISHSFTRILVHICVGLLRKRVKGGTCGLKGRYRLSSTEWCQDAFQNECGCFHSTSRDGNVSFSALSLVSEVWGSVYCACFPVFKKIFLFLFCLCFQVTLNYFLQTYSNICL